MTHFLVNPKDIFFVLKQQLQYGRLCNLDRYRDLDEKTLDLLVNEAIRFARAVVAPLQKIGETAGAQFKDGCVSCPAEFREAFRTYGRNGWIAAARDLAYGGQGFPHMMRIVINDLMYGACQAFNMAPSLTHGAAHLIESFAEPSLRRLYVPPMYRGDWAGTMCLTEPQAGSSLADIETAAVRDGDRFRIKGTKIFISWGDHDLTENIVHLLLARIDGAPAGVRGISLFIVPKRRVAPNGTLGPDNDVVCGGIEEKMGLHASPTATLHFGGRGECIGYLCGKENMGLAHMFQMMNAARINTGVSGMALASTAYRNAVAYARERKQGKDLAGRKKGSVPIIDHPDVRRMLLWMKGMVDGMRSMVYTAALWSDFALELPPGAERDHYRHLVEFTTPIVKAYCSEMGTRVCETAVQCYGGYGYCEEYPVAQYLRDVKILSLYEGTNGIQSLDLMGRKMSMEDGAPFKAFVSEIRQFCTIFESTGAIQNSVKILSESLDGLEEMAETMNALRTTDPLRWGAHTYPALQCIGDIMMVWRLLDMARAAVEIDGRKRNGDDAVRARVLQAKYLAETCLPLTRARMKTCMAGGEEAITFPVKAL